MKLVIKYAKSVWKVYRKLTRGKRSCFLTGREAAAAAAAGCGHPGQQYCLGITLYLYCCHDTSLSNGGIKTPAGGAALAPCPPLRLLISHELLPSLWLPLASRNFRHRTLLLPFLFLCLLTLMSCILLNYMLLVSLSLTSSFYPYYVEFTRYQSLIFRYSLSLDRVGGP